MTIAYLLSFVNRTSGEAVCDAVVTSLTVLSLDTLPPEFACVGFDLIGEELYELRFGILGRIVNVVVAEDAKELSDGEAARVEVGLEVLAEGDDLGGGKTRHGARRVEGVCDGGRR